MLALRHNAKLNSERSDNRVQRAGYASLLKGSQMRKKLIISMAVGLLGVALVILSTAIKEPPAPIVGLGLMLMGASVGYNMGLSNQA